MKIKRDENDVHSVPSVTPVQTNTSYTSNISNTSSTYNPSYNSSYNSSYISSQVNSEVFLTNLFAEKDERHIYTFGNEQYIQFLNTGKVKKAFAVLSDKRLYIRGRRYEVKGKGTSSPDKRGKVVKSEKVVDVKDVKTIEIGRVGQVRSFLYMYYAIITTVLAIAGFVIMLAASSELSREEFFNDEMAVLIMATLAVSAIAVALWCYFAMNTKSCISLLCDDTWIRFPLEKYVAREGYALMRHIIILQMPYRENVSAPGSSYNDSIFTRDGELIVKSKKIEPKGLNDERTVNLNYITDIEVFRPSLNVLNTVLIILFLLFGGLSFFLSRLSSIAILVAIIFLAIPPRQLRLKVTCNNIWFSFPIKDKQVGADIMRYIVEQQAHNEQKLSVSHVNE